MGQEVVRVGALPGSPLDAADEFHRLWMMAARRTSRHADLVLVFSPAGHEHRGWRLAAVQGLAREAAPKRVNGVVGSDSHAIDEVIGWLAKTPGITGQILAVDGNQAEID